MHVAAKHIEADPDDGEGFALLFIKGEDGNYLSLSRGIMKATDSGIHIEIADQVFSAIDAVTCCEFSVGQLRLLLQPGKIKGFHHTELVVSFPEPCRDFEAVRTALKSIFRGRESLINGLDADL